MCNWDLNEFITHFDAEKIPAGFKYNSGENTEWESIDSLRNLIKDNVDETFSV